MGKALQKAYLALFALLILVPAVWYAVTRALPLEDPLITLNSYIDYKLLRTSSSGDVVVGRDGWLFYAGSQDNDEDQIADYFGANLFTEEELSLLAGNMVRMRDEIESTGAEFLLVINPNKARVYEDKLPSSYGKRAEFCRLEQVLSYLREHTDLNVVYTGDAMQAYRLTHPDTAICFKYDSHWNEIGAYVATGEVNRALGFEVRDVDTLTIKENASPPEYDLARLMHLTNVLTDDKVPVVDGYTDFYVETVQAVEGKDFSSHNYGVEADAGKLLLIGDSYGAFMERYLSCNFYETRFLHYQLYDRSALTEEAPDVVIYETVERYLNLLLTYSADGLPGDAQGE